MSITREHPIVALVFSVLVMATSVEIGRDAIEALLTATTSHGTAALAAALVIALVGAPVGIRPGLKATRIVVTAAVLIGLALFGMGKAVVEVCS